MRNIKQGLAAIVATLTIMGMTQTASAQSAAGAEEYARAFGPILTIELKGKF